MGYSDWINKLSATRFGGWLTRATAAKLDPWIYRRTRGRFVLAGRPTIPQLALTTTGRRSGRRREVQLAALRVDGGSFVVVASNFGQEHHPGWMYNLRANPQAWVLVDGEEIEVTATELTAEQSEEVWPRLHEIVPQFRTYLARTDRDIRLFRLTPT
jgi:deazaflavin-dependent oxidoreductase (nitroreductase family)